MSSKQKIALLFLYLVAAALILFGVIAQVPDVLPPHVEGFTGLTTEQVQPELLQSFLILAKAIGVLYIAIGLTLAVLTTGPLRQGDRWAQIAIAALIFPLVFLAVVSFPFLPYGLFGPQTYPYVLVGLTVIALALSR
jgi:hypothetical protein